VWELADATRPSFFAGRLNVRAHAERARERPNRYSIECRVYAAHPPFLRVRKRALSDAKDALARLTLLERIPWCDFAPPPIALEAPREAWGSLGWTARAPYTTLSAKYFSVSPRISICDRANMACSLKG